MKQTHCQLRKIGAPDLSHEPYLMGHGGIVLCESGTCTLQVNFTEVSISQSESITLYPTDIIVKASCSADFRALAFIYDESMLREASMHMEESVYSALRNDRTCKEREITDHVLRPMFTILNHFFNVEDCECIDSIASMQLRSFFLGFYDFVKRNGYSASPHNESQRTEELFAKFMHVLEHDFKSSRDVQYYADRLYITRKYLGIIVGRKTGKSPKQLINEYVVMQLKMTLRNTNDSIRQIASEYHFSDDSLMIRYFKAYTGMTPVRYRRNRF